MDKKAAVLLAAYNGEKYLPMQLDSILAQTHSQLEIYIRDDGSTDTTSQIIQAYAQRDPRVHAILGKENLGYPGCFYALTDMEIDADYFFFSDQDDVWFPDKVAHAIQILEKEDQSKILCYYSAYAICDSDLNVKKQSAPVTKPITFVETLFEVCGLEFTMAINRAAKAYLYHHKPLKAQARGTWMSMLFSAKGKIIYDNRPYAYYRRHDTAVTNSSMGFFGFQLWRIKAFFVNDQFSSYRVILQDLEKVLGKELSEKDLKALSMFAKSNYFPYAFLKAFYPRRLRRGLFDEVALRAVFLLGRL